MNLDPMRGTSATTGKALSGLEHLRQSIGDVLSTPLGSRVMRRDYGSRLPRLVDAPLNPSTITDMFMATADALARWEPRIIVKGVRATPNEKGRVTIEVTGQYLPDGREVTIDGILV